MKKPFIKMIRSPNRGYFYDVCRNEMIAISDESYDYLNRLLRNEKTEMKPKEIAQLKEQGYLSAQTVRELKHPQTEMCEDILSRSASKITIQLTQDCNFRCKYCGYSQTNDRQRHHSSRVIPIETAKQAIQFLHQHSVDCPDVCVGFYGGEPLLEFEMLKELVLYAEKVFEGKNLLINLTTNASLLNDEIGDFFVEHQISVLISLDGIREINDKNRIFVSGAGTFDTVVWNLERLYSRHPDYYKSITVNMVLDPSNDFDTISRIFGQGGVLEHTKFQFSTLSDMDSDTPTPVSEDFTSKIEYHRFLGFLSLLNQYPYDAVSPIVKNEFNRMLSSMDRFHPVGGFPFFGVPSGPCVPGETRSLVTVEGKLIVCERVSETADCMVIGDIGTGFDMDKVRALMNIAALTPDECKDCWAFRNCGLCCKYAEKDGFLNGSRKLEFCADAKNFFYKYLRKIILMKEAAEFYPIGQRAVIGL